MYFANSAEMLCACWPSLHNNARCQQSQLTIFGSITDGLARHVWHLSSQEKADAMVTHLASLADQRLIISFAPFTPYYAVLKRIGELFPGPSKVPPVLSIAPLHSSRHVSERCIWSSSQLRRHLGASPIWSHLFHFGRHLADTAPGASCPPQITHVCHLLACPVPRRPPERTCTRRRTWKPPWSELASRCARPKSLRLQCMRLVPQSKSECPTRYASYASCLRMLCAYTQSILRGQLLQRMPSWASPVPVAVNDTLSVLHHTHRV